MNVFRTICVVLVQLFGALCVVMGLGASTIGTVLPYRIPRSHLYTFLELVVCAGVVFLGVAAILRFRVAAVGVAACFLAFCVEEAYGMSHGFDLLKPPHYSQLDIAVQVLIGLIPGILTVVAWPRLRSGRREPSNQSLEPTAGRSDV